MKKTIMLVGSHPLIMNGLCEILINRLDIETAILETNSFHESIKLSQNNKIDLILLDCELPDLINYTSSIDIYTSYSFVPVIALSAFGSQNDIQRAFTSGAKGHIRKSANTRSIIHTVKCVLNGGDRISVNLPVLDNIPTINNRTQIISDTQRITSNRQELKLTPRQKDVLNCIENGFSNKEIGRSLNITEATAKAHVTAILKTLNVSSRFKAMQVMHCY